MIINKILRRVLSNKVSNKLLNNIKPLKLLALRFYMYKRHEEKDCLKHELAGSLCHLPSMEIPRYLGIEGISACNSNCIFCEKQFTKRKPVKMDIELSRKIITDFIATGGTAINFACMTNEPLLDTDLYDKIKHIYSEVCRMKKSVKVIVITNGTLLKWNENYKKLIESGLTRLLISMSSFNRKDHEKIYRMHNYSDLLDGILLLLKENRKRGYPMKIEIGMRTGRLLKDVLKDPDFGLILPFIDFKSFRISYNHTYYIKDPRVESLLVGEMKKIENISEQKRIRPCAAAYSIIVTSEGKARICNCYAGPKFNTTGDDELVFADLNKMSLREALQSNKKVDLNKAFMSGEMPDICKKCDQYNPIPLISHEN